MAKRLPVPPELEYLLEKRETESDRRSRDRRNGSTSPQDASAATKQERRRQSNRRKKRRRKSDKS
jgi:hypothetical protein